jgi:hypothetical protein
MEVEDTTILISKVLAGTANNSVVDLIPINILCLPSNTDK